MIRNASRTMQLRFCMSPKSNWKVWVQHGMLKKKLVIIQSSANSICCGDQSLLSPLSSPMLDSFSSSLSSAYSAITLSRKSSSSAACWGSSAASSSSSYLSKETTISSNGRFFEKICHFPRTDREPTGLGTRWPARTGLKPGWPLASPSQPEA